jgi:hypothetical protein
MFKLGRSQKPVFSILAPYGRHKNGSFCDHPLDFFSGFTMRNLIYRSDHNYFDGPGIDENNNRGHGWHLPFMSHPSGGS